MNVSAFTIYLWQLADRVLAYFPCLAIFTTICLVILMILSIISNHEQAAYSKKGENYKEEYASSLALYNHTNMLSKIFAALAAAFFFVSAFLPTSNTIAMMVVIPEIAKSKAIQTDLPDLYNAAVSALKSAISPEKK